MAVSRVPIAFAAGVFLGALAGWKLRERPPASCYGRSLDGVPRDGSYTGVAITPASPFAHASMAVAVAGYATARTGSCVIRVVLQVSHGGSAWMTAGAVSYGGGETFVAVCCPGTSLRAVIDSWGQNVTGGAVTATVCGV